MMASCMTRGPCALLALLCSRSRKSGADKAKKKIKDGDLTLGPTRRSIRNEGKLVTYSVDALWEQQARAESPEAARIERELEVRHGPSLFIHACFCTRRRRRRLLLVLVLLVHRSSPP